MTTQALFDQSKRIFAQAESQELPALALQIGGRAVLLQFANAACAAVIGRSLRHRAAPAPGEPDLVIRVWDGACAPLPPSFPQPDGSAGYTHFAGAAQSIVDQETGRIEAYDPARRLALLHVPDLARLDPAYAGAPLRTVLHWWAIDQGWLLLHAGAVATADGAALLVGRGGSGKSTTVLGCIGSALGILGDDYCLYQPGEPGTVHSLFGSSKIDARAIGLLPHLAPAFAGAPVDPRGKRIIQVGDHFPGSWRGEAPLRAIIVPRIGSGSCSAEPISAGDALRALAPSTIFQLAGSRARALAHLAQLVRTLPCWRLQLGPDPTAAREPIAEMITSAARMACQANP